MNEATLQTAVLRRAHYDDFLGQHNYFKYMR